MWSMMNNRKGSGKKCSNLKWWKRNKHKAQETLRAVKGNNYVLYGQGLSGAQGYWRTWCCDIHTGITASIDQRNQLISAQESQTLCRTPKLLVRKLKRTWEKGHNTYLWNNCVCRTQIRCGKTVEYSLLNIYLHTSKLFSHGCVCLHVDKWPCFLFPANLSLQA